MKKTLFCLNFFILFNYSIAQVPLVKAWDYRYGGFNNELLWGLQKTRVGGFILPGSSDSNAGGNIIQSNWGMSYDMWVVKLDSNGLLQWQKRFGGTVQDRCQSVTQNASLQYLLGGWTQSDVSGDVSQPKWTTNFDTDYWIVLTDSSGNKIWDKRFGGTQNDFLTCSALSTGGKFILGGNSLSDISGIKSENSRGLNDFWIVKIDSLGTKIWDKTFGGTLQEDMAGIFQTSDSGYLLAGWSASGIGGDKSQAGYGDKDFWIVRIDSSGNKLWDKDYGGSGEDRMTTATPLTDGGFILAGYISSPQGNDVSEIPRGGYDLWLIRIDSVGNKIWDKRLGGISDDDELGNVVADKDGGYFVSGTSYSDIGADKTENNLGIEQAWVIKLDSSGNQEWDKTIFTTGHDETSYAVQTSEGCYVIAVWSQADTGGYKSEHNWCPGCFNSDYWIIKFCDSTQSLMPVAAVSLIPDICPGTCVDFSNLSINASSFQWSFPGAAPDTSTDLDPTGICYSTPGIYDVMLIAGNANGSDTLLLSNYITVYDYPPPQGISQSGDTLFAYQTTGNYQWFLNGAIINGATDYFYVAQANGNYNVVYTDSNGCEVEAAIFNVIASTLFANIDLHLLNVYPNPVTDKFKINDIDIEGEKEIAILVYNIFGEKKISTITDASEIINCSLLSPGMYFLEITISGSKKVKRTVFIKR
jgi:PKD repeat protein